MIRYLLWRVAVMIPTLILISMLVFAIIELPPGDYFESYVQELRAMGETADLQEIEDLKARYGFDQPMPVRYLRWVGGMLHGDFGYSFEYRMPVSEVVASRMWLTVLVSMVTIIVTWIIAFPIGIYSATHQYSWGDYGLTFLGLLGIAIPNFMLALILMYFANVWFGVSIGHLMDREFLGQPMSWEKARSILSHLWIPVLIIGTAGTAAMAEAVSSPATAKTSTRPSPVLRAPTSRSTPTRSPGITRRANSDASTPAARNSSPSSSRVRGFISCEVERIVYSHTCSPVSRYDSASGMKSTCSAAASAGLCSRLSA